MKNQNDPTLTDVLMNLKTDIFRTMNCVKIGKVKAFDQAKKTAQVQILFKKIFDDGTISSYPVLVDCPVFTLQGGSASLRMPVAAGDQCLVLFSDRNIDAWFQYGDEREPLNGRVHDISDGICVVGLNALTSTLPAYDANVNLDMVAGQKFKVTGGDAAEILGTMMLALKSDVDNLLTFVNNLITAFNAHVHTSAAPGNPTSTPTVPFTTTPPTVTGTTKLKGS